MRQGDGTYARTKAATTEPFEHRLQRAAILEVYADITFHLAVATASKNAILITLYQASATALRDALVKLMADDTIRRTESIDAA